MKLTLTTSLALIALALVAIAAFIWMNPPILAGANQDFCSQKSNANSTSTRAYMGGVGLGTTTLEAENCNGGLPVDSLFVAFQFTASTTAPLLDAKCEASHDKVDWYPINLPTVDPVTVATTTLSAQFSGFRFNLATSSENALVGSGNTSRLHRSFSCPTPMKYSRVIFSIPRGGAQGSLWIEAVGKLDAN